MDAYSASTEYRVTLPADDAQAEKKRAAIFTHIYSEGTTSTTHKGPEIISMSNVPPNNESDLMRQMRRAVEREQLIRALGEEGKTKTTESNDTIKKTDSIPGTGTNGTGISFSSATTTSTTMHSSSSVETGNLAAKEADVLQRMMEAAKLKKQKAAEAAAAAAVLSEDKT